MTAETETQRRVLDSLERGYKQLDEIVRQRVRLPVVTSCATCTTPGCCSQKVVSPFYEALPIARELRRTGRDTPDLRARLRADADAMEAVTRKAWLRAARPCAFLADGRCSVYAARPFSCRTYLVTTAPANCQPNAPDNTVAFINVGDLVLQDMQRAREIHRLLGLKETRKRLFIGVLPRLVLRALEVWDIDDPAAALRVMGWPTDDDLANDWVDGNAGEPA